MESLDLTAYCWRFYQSDRYRLRLVVYCVPGRQSELAKRLRKSLGLRFTVHAAGSIRVDRPEHLVKFAAMLGVPDETAEQLEMYKTAWKMGKKGRYVPADVQIARETAVRRVMYLQGLDRERIAGGYTD